MTPGVSVIICTYNGAKRITETLNFLVAQIVPDYIPWEIIIVDNASTDNTLNIATTFLRKNNLNGIKCSFLKENIAGKNYAFKKGLKAALYQYLLTCDDDNWLDENYIANAFTIMNGDRKIGALGGFGILEPEQPAKLKEEDLKKITVYGSQTWAVTEHWVYGAGSIYRTEILIELIDRGWQQITTGRSGSKLICGEDVEICFIMYLQGYKILADDCLTFKHFVPLARQSKAYILNLAFWMSYTNVLLNSYYAIVHNYETPIEKIINKWCLASANSLIKQSTSYLINKIKSVNNLPDREQLLYQSSLGTFSALIHNRKRIINHHKHLIKLLIEVRKPDEHF